MTRRRWSDLTPRQQRTFRAVGVTQAIVRLITWWDLWRRPADLVRGRKALWVAATFVEPVGSLAYWLRGRKPQPRAA